jgi:GTP diphosphokinase / guanosine-3',5'-bis(diphosphate) 3'-diphosphatase
MNPDLEFQKVTQKANSYMSSASIDLIQKAYSFAKESHENQQRISKEPYITHPVAVASILVNLEQDPASIAAALLHDTIEDTKTTAEDIEKEFGEDITLLVKGVTKLGKIYFESKEEQQAENFRKMFLAMAEDLRVVIIKLADRLHNMQTLSFLRPEKQRRIALETREIFSPLAHRLGMWSIKWELEDLCFYYLQPDNFMEIKEYIASHRSERERYVENFISILRDLLVKNSIEGKIAGRPKHFYSIYKKLVKQNISFEELYDTLGIRILLDNVMECYKVLGIIHSTFKPISGRIKDYIAMPKSNMYQSLHTSVIGPEGKPVEIQIRTTEMHQIAEQGIAAHWRYKEGSTKKNYDADFSWLRQILELQQEKTTPKDFIQDLKVDLFIDEVFVFTPKGDVQALPKEATPIDFAYKVHTEVGHCCIGAKVNSHIVTLNYKLKSGDRIEILTSKKANPKLDWLHFTKSAHAKSKIKQWFRKQRLEDNIQKGLSLLEKALSAADYVPKEILITANFEYLSKRFNITKYQDLYQQIAIGDVSPREVINYLDKHFNKEKKVATDESLLKSFSNKSKKTSQSNIHVLGEDHVMTRIAKCCHPLPGDEIIGFITYGQGVSIHRSDCRNIVNLTEKDKARLIDVEWTMSKKKGLYPVLLELEAFDRIGILQEIINVIADNKINISKLTTVKPKKQNYVKFTLTLDIEDIQQLHKLKNSLGRISDVYSISRKLPKT